MNVTFYLRPDGLRREMDIANIRDEDDEWFKSNGVLVSMEEISDHSYAIYADVGLFEDDNETPSEIIYLTNPGETCEDALSKLRGMCEEALNEA